MIECLFEKECEDSEQRSKRVCGLMRRSQNSSAVTLRVIKHDILTASHRVVAFGAAVIWILTMNEVKHRQILKENMVERPNIRGMFDLMTFTVHK